MKDTKLISFRYKRQKI